MQKLKLIRQDLKVKASIENQNHRPSSHLYLNWRAVGGAERRARVVAQITRVVSQDNNLCAYLPQHTPPDCWLKLEAGVCALLHASVWRTLMFFFALGTDYVRLFFNCIFFYNSTCFFLRIKRNLGRFQPKRQESVHWIIFYFWLT